MDLALNNLQRLIRHKTKPNQTLYNERFMFITEDKAKKSFFITQVLLLIFILISEKSRNNWSKNSKKIIKYKDDSCIHHHCHTWKSSEKSLQNGWN